MNDSRRPNQRTIPTLKSVGVKHFTWLTGAPTQCAILKTKGKAPILFRTYDLPETDYLENNQYAIRLLNQSNGYTLSLKELDYNLTFKSLDAVLPDEPDEFVE